MSFQNKLISKYKNEMRNKLYKSCYKHTKYDEHLFDTILERNDNLYDYIKEGNKIFKNFRVLMQDLFFSLYKNNLKLRTENDILPTSRYNLNILRNIEDIEGYEELKKKSNLNLLETSICLETLVKNLFSFVKKKKKQMEAISKLSSLEQKLINQFIQQHLDKLDDLDNIDNIDNLNSSDIEKANEEDSINLSEEELEELNQQLDNLLNQLQDSNSIDKEDLENLKNSLNLNIKEMSVSKSEETDSNSSTANSKEGYGINLIGNSFKKELKKNIKSLNTKIINMNKYFNSLKLYSSNSKLSGDSTTYHDKVDASKAIELVNRIENSYTLKKLAKLTGEFVHISDTNLKKKSKENGIEIKSVTLGDNIIKSLTSEKLLLTNENTKKLFNKKLYEKQLLQYDTIDDKRKGKGPIVVCLDSSSSMQEERHNWAKALALALLNIAVKTKRPYHIVFFDTEVVKTFTILNRHYSPDTILDIGSVSSDGGTSFLKPLNYAFNFIKKQKKFNKADIIFITDGFDEISESTVREINKQKENLNIYIQSILINNKNEYDSNFFGISNFEEKVYSYSKIDKWSDKVIYLTDLQNKNESVLNDIFSDTLNNE